MERQARKDREAKPAFASSAALAFLIYAVLAVVMTWPLASGLTRDIPCDFGDPLFTSWVLSFGADARVYSPKPIRDQVVERLRGVLAESGPATDPALLT